MAARAMVARRRHRRRPALGPQRERHHQGDAGRDTIYGSYGVDTLDGGSTDHYLSGSFGADEIIGGLGEDEILGGTGNDEIRVADDSIDHVDCGLGSDTVYVEDTASTGDDLPNCEKVVPVPP